MQGCSYLSTDNGSTAQVDQLHNCICNNSSSVIEINIDTWFTKWLLVGNPQARPYRQIEYHWDKQREELLASRGQWGEVCSWRWHQLPFLWAMQVCLHYQQLLQLCIPTWSMTEMLDYLGYCRIGMIYAYILWSWRFALQSNQRPRQLLIQLPKSFMHLISKSAYTY